jgi:hypothetical protein
MGHICSGFVCFSALTSVILFQFLVVISYLILPGFPLLTSDSAIAITKMPTALVPVYRPPLVHSVPFNLTFQIPRTRSIFCSTDFARNQTTQLVRLRPESAFYQFAITGIRN